jgi:hypothetical protein
MLAVIQTRGPAQELRATIDRLPLDVRQGILDGIKGQRIIAGAHADARGGVCPMVAAEVPWQSVSKWNVSAAQQAARAWDRYADASGSSRTATKRQLLALTSMLEASILQEHAETEIPLSDAISEYERARSRGSSIETPVTRPAVPVVRHAVPDVRPAVPDVPVGQPRYLGLADAYEVAADAYEVPADAYEVAADAYEVPADAYEVAAERTSPTEVPAERPRSVDLPVALPSPVEVSAETMSPHDLPQELPGPVDVPATRPSPRKRRETGERDRTSELRERGGWAWMRPFRSYDEYEETLLRALAELDSHERQLEELQVR